VNQRQLTKLRFIWVFIAVLLTGAGLAACGEPKNAQTAQPQIAQPASPAPTTAPPSSTAQPPASDCFASYHTSSSDVQLCTQSGQTYYHGTSSSGSITLSASFDGTMYITVSNSGYTYGVNASHLVIWHDGSVISDQPVVSSSGGSGDSATAPSRPQSPRSAQTTQSFSGNGSKNLGTITVASESTLTWTNDGDVFAVGSDLNPSNPSDYLSVSSQAHGGDSAVAAGTYSNVRVIAGGNWKIRIVAK
jgi:hypothetical protein